MIFKNTIEVAEHVKISINLDFDILKPYIQYATDAYITPYLGYNLVDKLEKYYLSTPPVRETFDNSVHLKKLLIYTQKTIAPFAVLLAVDETSINFGDTGHTVSRNATLAPASDAKIASYKKSLHERSWFNLEQLLLLLEQHPTSWIEWQAASNYTKRKGNFFSSAIDFQDNGLIDIQYSRLTFEALRMTIASVEATELKQLLLEAYSPLINRTYPVGAAEAFNALKALVCRFLAHRTACIFSSSTVEEIGYKPIIKPLAASKDNATNFYCEQAAFLYSEITNYIISNATTLGVTIESKALNFNSDSRRIVEFL